MAESEVSLFERIVDLPPPENPPVLFDTACVLGGSIAGLFAARVLADHARQVFVLERDNLGAGPRAGVPQGRHYHLLLPTGKLWLDRWLPGFTRHAEELGAVLTPADKSQFTIDDRPRIPGDAPAALILTRPFLEARVREKVLALPNISVVRGHATGLAYRTGQVSAVHYTDRNGTHVLPADFVVDAMGRASKLSDWLHHDGYDRPPLERVHTGIHYATTRFKRPEPAEELDVLWASARYTQPHLIDEVALAAAGAIEDDQWLMTFMSYRDERPNRTVDTMRATAARLPHPFPEVTAGGQVGDVTTFYQAESRRRDFTAVTRFPARLVSIGDAVASFNPTYGQGMSSAALHASCLSHYLHAEPDLDSTASEFFRLQKVIVDAAWTISATGDIARQEALNGVTAPPQIQAKRDAMADVFAATMVDETVATAFRQVTSMLAHPGTLGAPEIRTRTAGATGKRRPKIRAPRTARRWPRTPG